MHRCDDGKWTALRCAYRVLKFLYMENDLRAASAAGSPRPKLHFEKYDYKVRETYYPFPPWTVSGEGGENESRACILGTEITYNETTMKFS